MAEAVATSLEQLVLQSERAAELGAEAALNHALEYLSPTNRDDVEHTCTFAAAGSEPARSIGRVRQMLFQRRDVAQSGRVAGEDKVTTFDGHVAGKAAT